MTRIPHDERGGVIVGYFTKIAVVLAVFALCAFDAVAVGVAHMSAQDVANEAAIAGADSWSNYHNRTQAYRAAEAVAEGHDATIDPKTFQARTDGTVTLVLAKDANTMLLYRTKTTKKWTHVTATGHGKSV